MEVRGQLALACSLLPRGSGTDLNKSGFMVRMLLPTETFFHWFKSPNISIRDFFFLNLTHLLNFSTDENLLFFFKSKRNRTRLIGL